MEDSSDFEFLADENAWEGKFQNASSSTSCTITNSYRRPKRKNKAFFAKNRQQRVTVACGDLPNFYSSIFDELVSNSLLQNSDFSPDSCGAGWEKIL